jgi:hypothetical protein
MNNNHKQPAWHRHYGVRAVETRTQCTIMLILNDSYGGTRVREKTLYEENIEIPIPKDEVISAIEEKNQIWYRKMYTNKAGIICEHKNNPVRQDAFIAYYYSEPVTVGPGRSSLADEYPILAHLEDIGNKTMVNIKIIRKKSMWVAFAFMLAVACVFAFVPFFVPSSYLGGNFFRVVFHLVGFFGIFMVLKYFWANKPSDVLPGVKLLREALQELGQK